MRCGVCLLKGSFSKLLLLNEDVPQMFIHLEQEKETNSKRHSERGRHSFRQALWQNQAESGFCNNQLIEKLIMTL